MTAWYSFVRSPFWWALLVIAVAAVLLTPVSLLAVLLATAAAWLGCCLWRRLR